MELPPELRQDPVFHRTGGARPGRDGCRVPIPWTREAPAFGFTTGEPWLPQPAHWGNLSAEAQADDDAATLRLYRDALRLRPQLAGPLDWRDSPQGTLVFARGDVLCAVNVGGDPLALPRGDVLLTSEPLPQETLVAGTAAWIRA